jgi:YidC/Oxa1 family membrane protein insertase
MLRPAVVPLHHSTFLNRMDRKSIIILVVCFVVLVLWYPLVVNKLYPPKPLPAGSTNAPVATVTANSLPSTAPALPQPAAVPTAVPLGFASTNVPEELLVVTNDNAHYTFTSRGGGLQLIELLHYPETISRHREKQEGTNNVATLNTFTLAPTLALLDGNAVQGDGIFKLNRIENGVRAEKTLTNGLTIVKDFQLNSDYLVKAVVRLENRSGKALALPAQNWFVGTATPMGPRDNGLVVGALWYNGAKTEEVGASYFSSRGFACTPRIPPAEYRNGASNVVWVAVHNQFFTLAAMPQYPGQAVVVQKVDLPRPTGEEAATISATVPPPQGYQAALVYPALTIEPGKSFERQVMLFAGPKEYQTLARVGDRLNNNLDLVMNFGWFGFVSKALLLSMNVLHHHLLLSYGWSIIAITVIIKVVFWPLTQASTRSMKRMQAFQPQMNAIKEKYKDDPVKMNKKTMEFMREHKVSPLGGCLPMFLQIPVFFGFYRMILSAIELRGAPFLWVSDLARPDTLFIIPGTNFPFNLLPLIMGATMLWQARLTPPSPGMDPTQAKIMRYMPLMFMVFLYNFSSGLTLYWTVQNLLTIVQTKLTKTVPETGPPAKGPVLTPAPKKTK